MELTGLMEIMSSIRLQLSGLRIVLTDIPGSNEGKLSQWLLFSAILFELMERTGLMER